MSENILTNVKFSERVLLESKVGMFGGCGISGLTKGSRDIIVYKKAPFTVLSVNNFVKSDIFSSELLQFIQKRGNTKHLKMAFFDEELYCFLCRKSVMFVDSGVTKTLYFYVTQYKGDNFAILGDDFLHCCYIDKKLMSRDYTIKFLDDDRYLKQYADMKGVIDLDSIDLSIFY